MPENIDQAFIRRYEAEVHQAYQRQGSLLRNAVRRKSGVIGSSTTFQKTGTIEAAQKTRNGDVPVQDLDHAPVECPLGDWYAPTLVDDLDTIKTNIDERMVRVNASSWALGRKTDALIIAALEAAGGTVVGDYTTAFTKAVAAQAIEAMNANDLPDDGNRYAVLSPHAWSEMLNISEFSNADYVGDQYPWLKNMEARSWRNTIWLHHSGLPVAAANTRKCFMFHQTAVGHASGKEVTMKIDFIPLKDAWLFNGKLSQGAVGIDARGIVELRLKDDIVIA